MRRASYTDYVAFAFVPAAVVLVKDTLGHQSGFCRGNWVSAEDTSNSLRPGTLNAALALLAEAGIAKVRENKVRLTQNGRQFLRGLGYARWSTGYGSFLPHMRTLAARAEPRDGSVLREGAAIAQGSAEIGCHDVDPYLRKLVLSRPYTMVTDIGCGTAKWLIDLVSAAPCVVRGVGVDISRAACKIARANVANAGLSSRIEIICADAAQITEFVAPADLVVARFVLHDLVTVDPHALSRVANLVGVGGRLIFAEVEPHQEGSCFAAAFTLVHALMGQSLLTKRQWRDLLAAAGLTVVRQDDCGMPHAFVAVATKGRSNS